NYNYSRVSTIHRVNMSPDISSEQVHTCLPPEIASGFILMISPNECLREGNFSDIESSKNPE
ncbi:MAG: hypothetical protein ABF856_06505, partial [Acetobacter aceti]